jgi:hypothetical protein
MMFLPSKKVVPLYKAVPGVIDLVGSWALPLEDDHFVSEVSRMYRSDLEHRSAGFEHSVHHSVFSGWA